MQRASTVPADKWAEVMATLRRAAPVALIVMVLHGADTVAQDAATPVALPTPVDPAECTVEPRPREELLGLVRSGLPRAIAAIEGTPVAGDENEEGEDSEATPAEGEPVDAATGAAVTETISQYAACSTAGRLPALSALIVDEGAAVFLAFSAISYAQGATGGTAPPSVDLDPALLDAWVAAIAFPVPTLPESRIASYEVREVKRLDEERVEATVLLEVGSNEPSQDRILLREVDGRYLIVFGEETEEGADATPDATPVA